MIKKKKPILYKTSASYRNRQQLFTNYIFQDSNTFLFQDGKEFIFK